MTATKRTATPAETIRRTAAFVGALRTGFSARLRVGARSCGHPIFCAGRAYRPAAGFRA